MIKLTIMEEKPVPPLKRYVLELDEEEMNNLRKVVNDYATNHGKDSYSLLNLYKVITKTTN